MWLRDSISGSVQLLLDEATEPWGIKVAHTPFPRQEHYNHNNCNHTHYNHDEQVERLEIKDARLPVQLQVQIVEIFAATHI